MMGIAAGMRDKTTLGEVIISERVIYYEGATALEGGKLAPRPEIYSKSTDSAKTKYLFFSRFLVRSSARAGSSSEIRNT
jgi:nucleoside phosphorylase